MRVSRASAVLVMLMVAVCACQGVPRMTIPLLGVSNLGDCGLYGWDVREGKIVDKGTPLFKNAENRHSLLYTTWDGAARFILDDRNTTVVGSDSTMSVDYRRGWREAYCGPYVLSKEDDRSFALKGGGQNRHFRLESSVLVDGMDVRGDELGLSGFLVDPGGETISILLDTFWHEANRIKLYIGRVNLRDGTSQIREVKDCPTSLSPAFPPTGNNVIAMDGAFFVLSYTEVTRVDVDTETAVRVFDVSTLGGSRRFVGRRGQHCLMTSLGYFDGRLVVVVVADSQTASEATYLCLLDEGNVVASIKVDSEYVVPNLWDSSNR